MVLFKAASRFPLFHHSFTAKTPFETTDCGSESKSRSSEIENGRRLCLDDENAQGILYTLKTPFFKLLLTI